MYYLYDFLIFIGIFNLTDYLIGEGTISNLDEFLEDSGKLNIINRFNEDIYEHKDELIDLKDKKAKSIKNISLKEDEMRVLKEKVHNNPKDGQQNEINTAEKKLQVLKNDVAALNIEISQKNYLIDDLKNKRDEKIKKILMQLHSKIKKDHAKADKEHARYVKLFTQERQKKHNLERKMMNLKMMVYKEYGIRLI